MKYFIGGIVIVVAAATIIYWPFIQIRAKSWFKNVGKFLRHKGTRISKKQLITSFNKAKSVLVKIKQARTEADGYLEAALRDEKRWNDAAIGAATNNQRELVAENLTHRKKATDRIEPLKKHVQRLQETEVKVQKVVENLEEKLNNFSRTATEASVKLEADDTSTEAEELLNIIHFGQSNSFKSTKHTTPEEVDELLEKYSNNPTP
jgi:hypothetical protein